MDRHFASLQAGNLVGININAPSFAAEFGKANGGAEPDITGANYSNCFAVRVAH